MTEREPVPVMRPPLDVLVVSTWYPRVDDSTKGRFVADQVDALRRTGDVSPVVVSFEPFQLGGSRPLRRMQLKAWRSRTSEVLRARDAFNAHGYTGAADVPVARLPVPDANVIELTDVSDTRTATLQALAERHGPAAWQLVHAHTGFPDGAAAARLVNGMDLPLVITEHATFVGLHLSRPKVRERYIEAVRRAARFIAVSKTLGDELREQIPEVEGKLVVIPNTVAVDDFTLADDAARNQDELLYIGYRIEQKGIDTLLAAFAQVRRARPTATLRLIGGAPSHQIEERWHRMARELGVHEAVRFEPPALRAGVVSAMARASILVHASRRETFGMAPAEALAAGLPVVATDIGPLREILGDDPAALGELAPVGNPDALAAAIVRTLERRASFDPRALRASVVERYGAASVARRLVSLYDEVLSERAGRKSPVASRRSRTARLSAPAASGDGGDGTPYLVVGFNGRRAVGLLASLPPPLLRRIWLLTEESVQARSAPRALARTIAVEIATSYRQEASAGRLSEPRGGFFKRVKRALRDPRAFIARRLSFTIGPGERFWLDRRRQALAHALDEIGSPPEIVCIDGIDYLAADELIASGRARLVPGGLRWLADRWLTESGVSAAAAESSRTPELAPVPIPGGSGSLR